MRNGFGLRLLHKFFGIPFLYLQRSALEASLKKNEQDADICRLEITEFLKSTESDYSHFLENLISRKKATPTQSTSAPVTPLEALPRPTKSIILGGGHPIIVPNSNSHLAVASTSTVNTAKLASPSVKPESRVSAGVDALRIPKSATVGAIAAEAGPSSNSSGFVSTGGQQQQHGSPGGKISNVDEFCPDGGVLDKSFLDDTMEVALGGGQEMGGGMESDSDDDSHHNPLVSRFDDEFGGDGTAADVPQQPPKHLPLRSTSSSESVPKFNPLRRQDLTPSPNPVVVDRAFSLSSIELEIDQIKSSTPAGADSGSLNDSESWSLDTKERRSPEGGEDVGSNVSVTCSKSSSGSVKKSKDKDKERSGSSSKHKKSKKSSREKDDSREERRKSKRKSHSVVDDFVQQMKSSGDYDGGGGPVDDAYEAI